MRTESETGTDPRPRYDEEVHLVAGILERADRTARPSSVMLLTWGVLGTLVDLGYFVYYRLYYTGGHPSALLLNFAVPALAIGLAVTVANRLMTKRERRTLVDRAVAITFGIAGTLAAMPMFLGFPRWIMAGPDYSIMWNLLTASAAASLGLQYRAKPLVFGGLALAGSVVLARFDAYNIELILALGMLAGVAGPGLYYALRRAR